VHPLSDVKVEVTRDQFRALHRRFHGLVFFKVSVDGSPLGRFFVKGSNRRFLAAVEALRAASA